MDVEQLNYEGDNEKDDENDDEGGSEEECPQNEVPIIDEEYVEVKNDITQECMDCFEGYQSKSSDEYFTDSELEPDRVRIAKLVKGQSFKRMVDGVISFHIGQIFNSKEHMRETFKEYAIQEGIELKRVKNDKVKHTYKCGADTCGWRAHAFCMIDGVTFMLKTLSNQYHCHRVYHNKEAKVKLIASKFEKLVIILVSMYCAKHIYANFKLTYKGHQYKKLFWRAARSSNIYDFKTCMEEIGIINPAAKKWLMDIDPQHWSRYAYDPVIKCDHVTNNMTEAFNNMLSTRRAVSYLDLLEFIRRMVMRKFNDRNKERSRWSSVLPPRVHAKILKHSRESRTLTMIAAGNMEYEL
ncbi:hypothetical protein Ddye_025737 [Dipteronia dyeriana]|uniref:Transposase MuDR plant domain-containing protein n=1 Tax=Dipteronia dyeriana TaxID=168575 RepID=A0AAD9TKT2_9ROSI|nr:hypothetical protein Ddye_025737 [Dipteronia dyeriana]